jgi:hypothetical protein
VNESGKKKRTARVSRMVDGEILVRDRKDVIVKRESPDVDLKWTR